MKKRVLILTLIASFALPAFAELTVKDTTSIEFMKNQGYSSALVQTTQKSVARANGEPLTEPVEKEYYNQPVIKAVRRFFMYIDPSYDDHSFVNDHNIKTSPSYEDL